jgi:hypothetical protein
VHREKKLAEDERDPSAEQHVEQAGGWKAGRRRLQGRD